MRTVLQPSAGCQEADARERKDGAEQVAGKTKRCQVNKVVPCLYAFAVLRCSLEVGEVDGHLIHLRARVGGRVWATNPLTASVDQGQWQMLSAGINIWVGLVS
jgi:hypothetical protein